jgi:lipoate---protein ligase
LRPVNCCDLTLADPAENLACDEVLLELAEAGTLGAVLRFWEPTQYFVVLGYANRVATEVNADFCRRHDIPILRRCTGGGAVLQGPGCLNYSLVLPIAAAAELSGIPGTNHYVLRRNQTILQALVSAPVERQGHTDLTVGGLKFSGNSQRRRRSHLLFHGTFLLHADIGMIEKALPLPSYQPDYRVNRSHGDFLMNLKVPPHLLKTALIKGWKAVEPLTELPLDQVVSLATRKYRQDEWNLKF